MSQEIHMILASALAPNLPSWSVPNKLLSTAAVALLATTMLRSPLASLEPRELDPSLLGPQVLGERMVIPPNRPDWVLMDCRNDEPLPVSTTSLERVRRSFCRQ